jgi:hypothetical protein
LRLVAFLLSAALASALAAQVPQVGQGPRALPWQSGATPSWQPLESVPLPQPGPIAPSQGPLNARLSEDGTLEVWNGAGVRTLRSGIPGRPRKAWRDGGIPLDHLGANWSFPQVDPLSNGLGGLDWNAGDFRISLQGLLWILEDGERVLTLVHPATAQVIHLPLPRGDDFDLAFEPTRLVLKAGQGPGGHPQAWTLPWLALLPQFARLGPPAVLPAKGTALKPFPTGQ